VASPEKTKASDYAWVVRFVSLASSCLLFVKAVFWGFISSFWNRCAVELKDLVYVYVLLLRTMHQGLSHKIYI
jgi:hypothetical protein